MIIARAAGLLLIAASVSLAQAKPSRPDSVATTKLYVRYIGIFDSESGEPIAGAEVVDLAAQHSVLSAASGLAGLAFTDTGSTLYEVRKLGYLPAVVEVRHSAADTVPITVVLSRVSPAQTLPTVVIRDSSGKALSPALAGFEERRKTGFGRFITEDVLRKNDSRKVADVLQAQIPGAVILRRGSRTVLAAHRHTTMSAANPYCYPDVYLDGVRVSQPGAPFGLDELAVTELAGVEFYNASNVPPKFRAIGGGCGALLLWTRAR